MPLVRRTALALAAFSFGCGAPPTPNSLPTEGAATHVAKAAVQGAPALDHRFWQSAESVETTCGAALTEARRLQAAIGALEGPRTVENTLGLYNKLTLAIDPSFGFASVTANMHPDAAVRDAARGCEKQIEALINALNTDRGLYAAIAAVKLPADADPATRRFLSHTLREFRRAGVDKDDSTRAKLREMHGRMVELSQAFGKNLRDDTRDVAFDSVKDLDGLPADYIKAHPPGKDGKIHITTDYPDFFPFEGYATNAAHRKALYVAFSSRGNPKNIPLINELLKLRHEYANLLGYANWAAYHAETKMVKTPDVVDTFITDIAAIARPRAVKDLAQLLKYKRKDAPKAKHIEVWDRFYYTNIVRKDLANFDSQKARPYFSYPKVKAGIFKLYGELFGVRFEPIADASVWHESVDAYAMYEGDTLIGKFYLDMHPREGKYKHAAMFPMQTGIAGGQIPKATLVCNFPDPSKGDGKALMEHLQVKTFFHEFGHLIHQLLARRAKWVGQGGITMEFDFAEAPSQLLEEWAWDPKVLQGFAHHVDTGAPIPLEMVKTMKAAAEFGKGANVMRQIFYAAYSFYAHTMAPEQLDLDAHEARIYKTFSPYPALGHGTVLYTNFGHLVGYSSGYYTYQWSLSIAKDLFTRFEKEGLQNKAVAKAYREQILEQGGMKDAAEMVEGFLGRPYTLKAYKAWLRSGAEK